MLRRPVLAAMAIALLGTAQVAAAQGAPAAVGEGAEVAAAPGGDTPAQVGAEPAAVAPSAATLADLRAQVNAMSAALKDLRAQLNASGRRGFAAAGGDSAIDRMNAMERELSRLTGETERLRNRIERAVRDSTNRLGDIEFRLCEMEEGCDLGALTTPDPLGEPAPAGGAPAAPAPRPDADVPLTAAERAAFDAASAALQAGEFTRAAALFGDFARQHAGSPATAEAQFLRGAALDSAGDAPGATAAWLSAFAAAPAGPRAPDALLGLSRVSAVGKAADAGCVYLAELTERFPGTPQADEAARRSVAAGCAAPDGADGAAPDDAAPDRAAPDSAAPDDPMPDDAAPTGGGSLPAGAAVPGDGG